MGRFNLDEYSPVEERIALFYEQHPTGAIRTEMAHVEGPVVVFKAYVYKDLNDQAPWATGYAHEREGDGHVNTTSHVENCETSAIGRALANAGYHGRRDGAPRPSREEMQKVERMGQQPAGTASAARPARGGFDLSEVVGKGKYAQMSWAEVAEKDPGYIKWAIDKMTTLSGEAKNKLRDAISSTKAQPAATVAVQDLLNRAYNDKRVNDREAAEYDEIIGSGDAKAIHELGVKLTDRLLGKDEDLPF